MGTFVKRVFMSVKPLILDVRHLTTSFQRDSEKTYAVNDVSFSIKAGETIGIVGESGSGKSVTALSILRLIQNPQGKIEAGEILFRDSFFNVNDLLKLSEKDIRKYRGREIAMIFQEPMTSLNPVFKCGTQVSEVLRLHFGLSFREAKKRTIDLFEEVRLPRAQEMYKYFPHQISGGQKQRVMIAMAIACNPKLLIADEPTTALDVTVQKTILDLLKDLRERHEMSILFITHDLGLITGFADKILVMHNGAVVEYGETQKVFDAPKHPYTQGLMNCRPVPGLRVRQLPTVEDFLNGNITELESKRESPEEQTLRQKLIYSKRPILSISHLKTYFPSSFSFFGRPVSYVKAVDDVSFDVYQGETLGIVGESGCGKTTLGRSILMLISSSSGNIIFDGVSLREMKNKGRRRFTKDLQIIFQDPYSSLNPRIKAGMAITEPMRVHEIGKNDIIRKEKALELLNKVGLRDHHFDCYPHEFSGGQRQRICIARALALSPKLIICDESVSALDISVQAQVLNLLNQLKNEFGFTYIFISHNLSVVNFMSDRVIVMKSGKIEEIGYSDRVFSSPESSYTKKLIEAIPH